jgi:hypothetical protein
MPSIARNATAHDNSPLIDRQVTVPILDLYVLGSRDGFVKATMCALPKFTREPAAADLTPPNSLLLPPNHMLSICLGLFRCPCSLVYYALLHHGSSISTARSR